MGKTAERSERLVIMRNATLDQYFALDGEDYRCTEMIEGEITLAPMPAPYHQRIVARFMRVIEDRFPTSRAEVLPGLDVVIDSRNTLQPDVLFYADFSERESESSQFLGILPDLVVEIISPQGEERDRVIKYALYQKAGIANYWIVDPQRKSIDAFTLIDGEYQAVKQEDTELLAAPPFADKPIALSQIFPAE